MVKKVPGKVSLIGRDPYFCLRMRAPGETPTTGHVISGRNTRKKGGNPNFRLRMRMRSLPIAPPPQM